MDSPEDWDDDGDNAALIAAQNRGTDEEGDPNAADPESYEEHALTDPAPVLHPDADDDFSDLIAGLTGEITDDDDDEDYDDD